jgi:hypothetical protein
MKFVVIGESSGVSMDTSGLSIPGTSHSGRFRGKGRGHRHWTPATWRFSGLARRPRPFQGRTHSSLRAWSSRSLSASGMTTC